MKITSEERPCVCNEFLRWFYATRAFLSEGLFWERVLNCKIAWPVPVFLSPEWKLYFCSHALSRGTKKSRTHVGSNLRQNMRSRTQNSQGAQCTNFHLRRGCNVINFNYQRESGEKGLIPAVHCVWHASQIRGINYLMRSRRILDWNEIKKNSRSGENT